MPQASKEPERWRPSRAFFYWDGNKRKDADLHEPILAGGDEAAAKAVSRAVAIRLGVSPERIDALYNGEAHVKEWDESKHPRVPGGHGGGRFTSGGDGGGAAADDQTSETQSEKKLLIGTGASRERIEEWQRQLYVKADEFAKQGKLGSVEDTEVQHMLATLGAFLNSPREEFLSGEKVFYEVHDLDGNLLATVFSQFNPKNRVATIEFIGGLDPDAKVKALQFSVQTHQNMNSAERIEATEWADDETGNLAAYEQAGFQKVGGVSGGIQRFVIGAEQTGAEKEAVSRTATEHVQRVEKIARDVASDLGFDPSNVLVSLNTDVPHDEVYRELNGRQFMAAGLAYIYSGGPNSGKIRLFPEQFAHAASDDSIKGVTAHEVEHIKYQTALNRFDEEFKLVMADPGPPPDPNHDYWWGRKGGKDAVMAPNGLLHPPYDKKYPVYQAMEEAQFFTGSYEQFRNSDGVSNYSREWWTAFGDGKASVSLAMHETLAEMGKAKYVTGKFPEHMGDKNKPPPTKKEAAEYAKTWRDLYRTVEKIYTGKI